MPWCLIPYEFRCPSLHTSVIIGLSSLIAFLRLAFSLCLCLPRCFVALTHPSILCFLDYNLSLLIYTFWAVMADEANRPLLDGHSSHEWSTERSSTDQPRPSYQFSTTLSRNTSHQSQDELTVYSNEQRLSRSSSGGVLSNDTFQTAVADEANRPLLDAQPTAERPKSSFALSSESTNMSTQTSTSDELTVYSSEQLASRSSSGAGSNRTLTRKVVADEPNQHLPGGQSSSHGHPPERPSADQFRSSFELSSESTPLLHRRDDEFTPYGTEQGLSRSSSIVSQIPPEVVLSKRSRVPWPTVISLTVLTLAVLSILVLAFAAPAAIQEYGKQAAVFKPTAVSIDSTTPDGVRARVQGDFMMDSGHVKSKSVRGIGRFATWIAREIQTSPTNVEVYLPEYGNVLVGTAAVPTIKLNIRNGHHTTVDFLTDLGAGDIRGIHAVAIDWIEGRLGRLSVKGKATIALESGLIALGTQVLTHNVIFEGIF